MTIGRFYPPCDNRPMCGRYTLHAHPDVVALLFGLSEVPAYQPRFNIAPASQVLIVRRDQERNVAAQVRWGLVPRWAKDPSIGARMNNARAETVAQKPSFREAYRKRRCLIPASGFYEWKAEGGRRQPYYVYPAGAELFAFAGLWERWQGPHLSLETCAIITTEANAKMAPVHERMPVIVSPADYPAWLTGGEVPLKPCADEAIGIRRVSRAVNNARVDHAGLVEPEAG
ncbi:MAG: SOS response-associated peptidase [Burkholderiales bacterium]|nr:SOS response-associated peptidase [Burkholderiales bacterium]